jgi:hypothetical protein
MGAVGVNRYIAWQQHPPTHEPSPAEAFFTETVPDFFTVDIPHGFAQFGQALSPVAEFATEDVPHFFTETVPEGLGKIGHGMEEAGKRALLVILGLLAVYLILKKGIDTIFR